jgi:N-acetylglucosamine-6-phosphate deacetylase
MSENLHVIAAGQVFDGAVFRKDAAVVIDGTEIAAVMPRAQVPGGLKLRELSENTVLAPGLIDIQVNGGGDVLFNDETSPRAIRAIVTAHRRLGTTALLPTLISDSGEKMHAALAAVESLIGAEPGLLGIHLEGPFLSPQKPGVHDPRALRRPSAEDIAMLTAARKGAMLVTLAPERVPAQFIRALAGAGVRVALGHSMATYAETRAAMAEGLTGFTHLFNAMRPLDRREPGPIAAALESADAYYGLIADGVHVAAPMLRLALRGVGRPILVSDAMPPVAGIRSFFTLYGERIFVRDGRCQRNDGTLAGACLALAAAVRHCVRVLDLPLADALRFASAQPAEFLGLGNRLGKLAPGFRADMVALDGATITVVETWVAGKSDRVDARAEAGAS